MCFAATQLREHCSVQPSLHRRLCLTWFTHFVPSSRVTSVVPRAVGSLAVLATMNVVEILLAE